jgi:multimeric flavodoxin WrbA
MKCLIINGSPRKGNTWALTMLVKENIQKLAPDMEFEEIQLKDLDLPFCTDCSLCFRKGHLYCPHHEVMQNIMDKISEADGVILSVTCYQFNVPALTKNFADHMCFMLHRPRYYNKKALIVSTAGGYGANGTTKYMEGTFRGWGFNKCYQLPVNSISWNNYKPTQKDIEKCRKVTEKFYNDLSSRKLHPPKFGILIPFNLFRGMSKDYKPGTEYESRDGTYWDESGLADKTYFPLVPLPIHKRLFGNMFYFIAKKVSGKMIVTYKK